MNQHQPPTAADFFAQQHEDDDTEQWQQTDLTPHIAALDSVVKDMAAGAGQLWQIPPDPMERVARTLEALVEHFTADKQPGEAEDESTYSYDAEIAQVHREAAADAQAKLQALTQVISDVEAALGKSTAKPALAAKAVIDAWRNPQVPVDEPDPYLDQPGPDLVPVPLVAANPDNLPGHTRAATGDDTPDICQECSYSAQDYVVWPCRPVVDGLGSTDAANAIFVPEEAAGAQPEEPPAGPPANDAPVEAWREYARSQGLAGPHIDKANRSQIRTALGIAHQPTA